MVSRYRGLAGEYMWEKEKQLQQRRIDRYQDRPWELQSGGFNIRELILTLSLCTAALLGLLFLLSFLVELT
jgi:4-hydroxybenzoate polyprenyltransferase